MVKCNDKMKRFIILLIILTLSSYFLLFIKNLPLNYYIMHTIFFSFKQSILSTTISIIVSILLARALFRQNNIFGYKIIINLLSIPIVLPTIVSVFSIIAIYGNQGLVNQFSKQIQINIYGLNGILIAHCFLNIPLATRILLQHFKEIPIENWYLAKQLSLKPLYIFKFIEWPLLKQKLPPIISLIFLLCFTSFTVILILGNSPKTNTIQVAIYQLIHFEYNIVNAIILIIFQLILGLLFFFILPSSHITSINKISQDFFKNFCTINKLSHFFDVLIIVICLIFILTPIICTIYSGINTFVFKSLLCDIKFWYAVKNSLIISISTGTITVLTSVSILLVTRVNLDKQLAWFQKVENFSFIVLLIPPITFSGIYFILFWQYQIPNIITIIIINILMTMPFVLKILSPSIYMLTKKYYLLYKSLDIKKWTKWKLIYWPNIKSNIILSWSISASLSLRDLGAVCFFGGQSTITIPALMYQKLNSYNIEEVPVIALILTLFSLSFFYLTYRKKTQ